jgi:hypothetical protein
VNDAFNYVAVLVSIIIGLAATRLLSAMSEMLQVANRPRIYWIHIMWILTIFMQVMLFWWVLYRWHYTTNWNFFLFVWVSIPSILVYLASAILFPGELETSGSPDWRDYYYKNRRSFFLIFGAIAPLDVVDTLLKGTQHFFDQGTFYLPFIAVWAFGSLAAAITANPRYHAVWAIAFPAMIISYTTVALLQLG